MKKKERKQKKRIVRSNRKSTIKQVDASLELKDVLSTDFKNRSRALIKEC